MNCIVCEKKLRKDNTIGTCRAHRGLSPVRRAYEKSWQQDHSEQYVEAKKQWGKRNPKYFVDYRNKDISKKIAHNLRVRIRHAINRGSAIKNLGCTVPELLAHLEAKFAKGMTWQNYGKWHVDHILPLSSFDLTNPEQLKRACHYSNLQPLWGADNIRKHAKLDYHSKSA